MSTPTVRSFSRNIEARFLEEDSVPKELQAWWAETRDNLERLKDKITELQAENASLSTQLEGLSGITNQFTDAQAEQLARFVEFWEITSNGSLVPYTHNTSDIGSAGRKVQDIYEHDA
jgi:predicted nuclease with TOPRIM domain